MEEHKFKSSLDYRVSLCVLPGIVVYTVFPELGRLRQEDYKIEANLGIYSKSPSQKAKRVKPNNWLTEFVIGDLET